MPDWMTPERFAMCVAAYLLWNVNKTMGELRDAVRGLIERKRNDND